MVKQATCFFKVFLCKLFVQNLCFITKQHFFSLLKRTKPSFIKMSNPFKKPFLAVFGQKMAFFWNDNLQLIYFLLPRRLSFSVLTKNCSFWLFWKKLRLCWPNTSFFCAAVINAQLRCHLFLRNVKNAPFVWSAIFRDQLVFPKRSQLSFFFSLSTKNGLFFYNSKRFDD